MAASVKTDVYQIVTDKILEQMDKGIIPWQKPWHGGLKGAISYVTGRPYSLLNQLILGREGEFLTFNQIKSLGGHLKKGAKSDIIVFFKWNLKSEFVKNEEGEMEEVVKRIPCLVYHSVFHIDDCEGITPKFSAEEKRNTLTPIEDAEKVVTTYYERESCRLSVRESNKAYYSPILDEVVVPTLEQYDIAEEYYSTLFHETTHSTGHKSRLDRDLANSFGTDPYAKEELVAEIGSSFLCHEVGIDCQKAFKNSVAYIQSWSERFKRDRKLIVFAASRAEKAVRYILEGKTETEE